ncbi:MAG: hypothetical protein FWC11_03070 [Firmicutes bacterium]|nr:hypothetical protein [Bacillota bacterium]
MLLLPNQTVQLGGHYYVKNTSGEVLGTMILKAGDTAPPLGVLLNYLELME